MATKLRSVSFLLLWLTFSYTPQTTSPAEAAPKSRTAPPPPRQLLGLDESLDSSMDVEKPEVIARKLWSAQFERFVELQRDWITYRHDDTTDAFLTAKAHKAGALCVDKLEVSSGLTFMYDRISSYGSAWGTASEYDTQDTADARALQGCEAAKNHYGHPGCECRLVANDGGAVTTPPSDWLTLIPPLQKEIVAKKRERLARSEFHATLPQVLTAVGSQSQTLNGMALDFLSAYRLRAPIPLVVGYPDMLRDYASICHERYSYALVRLNTPQAEHAAAELRAATPGKRHCWCAAGWSTSCGGDSTCI